MILGCDKIGHITMELLISETPKVQNLKILKKNCLKKLKIHIYFGKKKMYVRECKRQFSTSNDKVLFQGGRKKKLFP